MKINENKIRIELIVLIFIIIAVLIMLFVLVDNYKDNLVSDNYYYKNNCLNDGYGKCFDTKEERDNYSEAFNKCVNEKKQCDYSCIDIKLPIDDCLTRCLLKKEQCFDVNNL